ncbi:phage tail assembly protein [Pectobacterium carotovorum]|uniref:phage tail assembly protein n=1 Tax=Pectobacterium carotovorum TaxID=554 RepID=UPI00057F4ABC|nr:phage tail assembly protein [Pectobacterium carotovorum]KHT31199.1 tail protein [Pectobacterium carotovorum subsp. carotovorum]
MSISKITLSAPIKRKGSEITHIEITQAIKQAGSLRGLRLGDVINLDFDAVSTLLTRVTSPALTLPEIASLSTSDFFRLNEALVPFLAPQAPTEQSEAETENN